MQEEGPSVGDIVRQEDALGAGTAAGTYPLIATLGTPPAYAEMNVFHEWSPWRELG